jgi:hypothetical protein
MRMPFFLVFAIAALMPLMPCLWVMLLNTGVGAVAVGDGDGTMNSAAGTIVTQVAETKRRRILFNPVSARRDGIF